MNKYFVALFSILFLLLPSKVSSEVRINEIYPAPTNGEYEWVELYNDENSVIDLKNYYIKDIANNLIKLNGNIDPFDFYIATSSGILNNSGDSIYLVKDNNIIDSAEFGSSTSNYSFSRCPDGIDPFIKSSIITKKESNNKLCTNSPTPILTPTNIQTITPEFTPITTPTLTQAPTITITNTPTPTSTNHPTNTVTPTQTPVQNIQNIYISEIYPNPKSGELEWVELFNNNDYDVYLNSWFIDDEENAGSSPKKFSIDVKAKSYKVISFTSSIFNNKGDYVRLINSNYEEVDKLQYIDSIQGVSFGRNNFSTDELCLQEPSPELQNNICIEQTDELTNAPTKTLTNTKTPTYTKTPTNTKTPTLTKEKIIEQNRQITTINTSSKKLSKSNIKNSFKISYLKPTPSTTKPEVLSANTSTNPYKNESPIGIFSLSSVSLSAIQIIYTIRKILS